MHSLGKRNWLGSSSGQLFASISLAAVAEACRRYARLFRLGNALDTANMASEITPRQHNLFLPVIHKILQDLIGAEALLEDPWAYKEDNGLSVFIEITSMLPSDVAGMPSGSSSRRD